MIDDLNFGDYWPPSSQNLIREFLRTEYDPEMMPALSVNRRDDGTLWLLGWEAPEEEPSLLDAARGWALTESEEAWARFLADGGVQ